MSQRYLVIAECIDSRNGKRFKAGDEFLPAPTAEQAVKLTKAGCLSEVPDSAPALPGSDKSAETIADLESTIDTLRGRITQNAITAGNQVSALQTKLNDANDAQRKLFEDFQALRDKFVALETERDGLRAERDGLVTDKDALNGRVTELEGLLADATKPAEPVNEPKPTKPGKAA
jgi:hypothetical protein